MNDAYNYYLRLIIATIHQLGSHFKSSVIHWSTFWRWLTITRCDKPCNQVEVSLDLGFCHYILSRKTHVCIAHFYSLHKSTLKCFMRRKVAMHWHFDMRSVLLICGGRQTRSFSKIKTMEKFTKQISREVMMISGRDMPLMRFIINNIAGLPWV